MNNMARTAHTYVGTDGEYHTDIIEHGISVRSHLALPTKWRTTDHRVFRDGIHGAHDIITSDCALHIGLSAYAASKENGDTRLSQFLTRIQELERGNIGAGIITTRRALNQQHVTFFDELAAADALTDTDMSDRWGHESSALPKLTMGFDTERPVSRYTPDDGYSRLPHRERMVRDPRTFALIDTWAK